MPHSSAVFQSSDRPDLSLNPKAFIAAPQPCAVVAGRAFSEILL